MISNGDKNYNRKRVGSYSVCNQTSDLRNRTNDKWESDFLITRMITNNRTARNQKSKSVQPKEQLTRRRVQQQRAHVTRYLPHYSVHLQA